MLNRFFTIAAVTIFFLPGCAAPAPQWRAEAVTALERINTSDPAAALTDQYHAAEEAFLKGSGCRYLARKILQKDIFTLPYRKLI